MTMSAGSNEQHQVRPPFGPSAAPQPIAIAGGAIVPVQVQQNSVQVPMSGLLSPASALEHYRLTQLYQYAMAAERLRCPPGTFLPPIPPGLRPELAPLFYGSYCRIDPRLAGLCRPPEEPKPQHSYIGLIAMAILGHPDKKLVLSDIYQYILDNYPYFRTRGPGWRNSIRHNLSLNDCFIKAGRSANGKGHYWAIHPANVDDFTKGDFRRRKAQRKVRRHMGLAVDDEDSPSPPPASPPPAWHHPHHGMTHAGGHLPHPVALAGNSPNSPLDLPATLFGLTGGGVGVNKFSPGQGHLHALAAGNPHHHPIHNRKRQFDVASLLAPEKNVIGRATSPSSKSDDHDHENDNNSMSSSSPPSSLVNSSSKHSKLFKKSVDSDDEDDEPIEVTEDMDNDIEKGNEGSSPTRCGRRRHNSHGGNDDVELENDEVTSSMGNNPRTPFQSSGQQNDGGNSSNDEEDVFTNSLNRHSRHVRSGGSNGNANNGGSNNIDRRGSPSSTNNSMCPVGNNNSAFAIANELLSHNQVMGQNQHPQQGGMPPLEFLGAQHLFNQGPHGQQFQFNPNHHPLLQHNPSLASLMILSSRYREITSNMANAKRTQQ